MERTRHQDVTAQLDLLVETSRPGTFPLRLERLTRDLLKQGYSRDVLCDHFEEYRQVLQAQGLEDHEDDLLNVMDRLSGWVSPQARI